MIVAERFPKLALHWQNKFLWLPIDENFSDFALSGFAPSMEAPILAYVKSNMMQVATINIGEVPMVEIYQEQTRTQHEAVKNE
jgi:hypothetical protein